MLAQMIKEQAVAWSIAFADPDEILRLNILHATMAAMKRAIEGLSVAPDKVWIDGNRVPKDLNVPAEAVVKGDSKIIEISAASGLQTRVMRKCMNWRNAIRNTGLTAIKATARRNILAAVETIRRIAGTPPRFAPVKTLLAQGNLFEE